MIYLIDYNQNGHRPFYGKLYEKYIKNSKYVVVDNLKNYYLLFKNKKIYFLTGDDYFIRTLLIALIRGIFNKKTFINHYHLDYLFKQDLKSKIKRNLIFFLKKFFSKKIILIHFNENKKDILDEIYIYIPEIYFGFNFNYDFNDKKIKIFFGGAISKRKGFNKLIEGIYKYYSMNKRRDFVLYIVGSIDYNLSTEISKKLNYLINKKVIVRINERLNDYEFDSYIFNSNLIVLPYLKSFNSNSGILSKAIFYEKLILSSNHGYIGEFIRKYDLGILFDIDNIEDFVHKFDQSINNYFILINKFKPNLKKIKKMHSLETVFSKINGIINEKE